jgi:hypothetical protein
VLRSNSVRAPLLAPQENRQAYCRHDSEPRQFKLRPERANFNIAFDILAPYPLAVFVAPNTSGCQYRLIGGFGRRGKSMLSLIAYEILP